METSTVRLTYVFKVPWSEIYPDQAERYVRMSRESLHDMVVDGGVDFDKNFIRAEVVDAEGTLAIVEESPTAA